MNDDRVLKPTRVISVGIIPVLVAAFVILYLLPTRTRQQWAWEMHPTMTAMVMGGGYLSGAYFFYRAATLGQWHRIGLGFGAHHRVHRHAGNRHNRALGPLQPRPQAQNDTALLYFSTPILLPWLWPRNRTYDPIPSSPATGWCPPGSGGPWLSSVLPNSPSPR